MTPLDLSHVIESNLLSGKSRDTIEAALRRGIGQPPVPVPAEDIAAAYDLCLARLRSAADTDDDAIAVEVRILQGLYEKAYKADDHRTASSILDKISRLKSSSPSRSSTQSTLSTSSDIAPLTFHTIPEIATYLREAGFKLDKEGRNLRNHLKAGYLGAQKDGTFTQRSVDRYALHYLKKKDPAATTSDKVSAAQSRRVLAESRERIARAEMAEIELARIKGEVTDASDVRREWQGLCIALSGRLMAQGLKYAAQFAEMTDQTAIRAIIDAENRHLLEDFALYEPDPIIRAVLLSPEMAELVKKGRSDRENIERASVGREKAGLESAQIIPDSTPSTSSFSSTSSTISPENPTPDAQKEEKE